MSTSDIPVSATRQNIVPPSGDGRRKYASGMGSIPGCLHDMAATLLETHTAEKIFLYVRINKAMDYVKCGWMPHESLLGTSHGEHSVLMEWIPCGCKMPRP